MRYEMTVAAYDVLDRVMVGVVMHQMKDQMSPTREPVLCIQTQVRGSGEADPLEWARDALVAALEAM